MHARMGWTFDLVVVIKTVTSLVKKRSVVRVHPAGNIPKVAQWQSAKISVLLSSQLLNQVALPLVINTFYVDASKLCCSDKISYFLVRFQGSGQLVSCINCPGPGTIGSAALI
jgi:hypothetical protein